LVTVYLECIPCHEREERIRLARRVSREVPCLNCGERVNAFVDPGVTSVARCKACTPKVRQPRERETFLGEDRMLSDGKRGARGVMGRRKYSEYLDQLEAQKENSKFREEVFTRQSIEDAQKILGGRSIRDVQREYFHIGYSSTREGITRILRLRVGDLEIPPPPPPPAIKHKPLRKCEHGVMLHKDDRRGKARYCGVCRPNNARLANLSKGEPQEKRRVRSELEQSFERLAEMDIPEEFGAAPLDPRSAISQDVA